MDAPFPWYFSCVLIKSNDNSYNIKPSDLKIK